MQDDKAKFKNNFAFCSVIFMLDFKNLILIALLKILSRRTTGLPSDWRRLKVQDAANIGQKRATDLEGRFFCVFEVNLVFAAKGAFQLVDPGKGNDEAFVDANKPCGIESLFKLLERCVIDVLAVVGVKENILVLF